MPDFGLFEAAHIACPVLPQYHPKQLMELLSSGKIRWVKAILGHLVSGQRSTAQYAYTLYILMCSSLMYYIHTYVD